MSPKLDVLPLSYWCLKYVSSSLVNSLGGQQQDETSSETITVLVEYLQQATGDVLQDLLREILSCETLDAATRFAILNSLLREDVRRLDTGSFPHSYYEPILHCIRLRASGLQHLNLKGIWLREYPDMLIETLATLRNLKVLIIPHMASDIVIKFLLANLSLNVLDVSGESIFTRTTLKSIGSDSLRVLGIGTWGKKNVTDDYYIDRNEDEEYEVIACIIKNFPNLVVLKTYSFTGRALSKLQKENASFSCNLKYLHDTGTNLETLQAMANLCPQLESINFNGPTDGVLNNLPCSERLNSLKVSAADVDGLREYLSSVGSLLHTLKVFTMRGGSIDVTQICVDAPELRVLEFYKCKLICLQPDNYFVSLQSLEILYCDASDSLVKYFLMNTPFLRRFLVGDVLRMTDCDMFRLCADCPLASLEELWFSTAKGLTVTTVQLLMGHCPNLKVLGQLNGWNVTGEDVDYLRALVLSSNMDLTLLPLESI